MSSSPDPLNDDPTFYGPPRSRPSKPRHSLTTLQTSSPKKQTFELDVGGRTSPHKIRVTVEAGDADIFPNYNSVDDHSPLTSHAPKNRRQNKTTTTTVPLRGLSDSEDMVRSTTTPGKGRGRPRKSIGTPIPAKRRGRVGTPKPSRKSFEEVDGDEDESTFSVGRNTETGRGSSRSESRPRKAPLRKARPAQDVTASSTTKKARGRKRKSVAEDMTFIAGLDDASTPRTKTQGDSSEARGSFLPVEVNKAVVYSASRSSASVGEREGDTVIARFHPGEETPRRTGWSSPRIFDGLEQPDEDIELEDQPPSPIQGMEDAYDTAHASASSQRESHTSTQEAEYGINDNDEQDQAVNNEEYREFDTIMESEGFSMIDHDSVPSLQKYRSSPWDQHETRISEKASRNKSLLSVMELVSAEDSLRSIPGDILEEASSQRRPQDSRPSESSSSKPPLDHPGPDISIQKSHGSRLLSVNNSRIEDSFSSIAPELLEAATPGRAPFQKKPMARTIKQDENYEDSFSAIPGSILEAATPAAKRQLSFEPTNSQPGTEGSGKLGNSGSKKSLFPSQLVNDTSPRMLTPEETPSPPPEPQIVQVSAPVRATSALDKAAAQDLEEQIKNESSAIYSQMASSPPLAAPQRYTYTAHLRQHHRRHTDLVETPSIVFSSPNLPPPIQPPRQPIDHAQGLPENSRPTLSPVARTGRVLQDVEVPHSSPRSRSQSLGSPFKSPGASKTSSSGARDLHESPRHRTLPQVSLNADLVTLSSGKSTPNRPVSRQEDPFSNNGGTRPSRSPSVQDKEQYSLELPVEKSLPNSRVSTLKSNFNSLRSEDAMSWQAEEEINIINKPSSASKPLTSEERWAAERAEVSRKIADAGAEDVIVIESEGEEESYEDGDEDENEDEDEDVRWLLDTMESSPAPSNQTPAQPEPVQPKEVSEKPRRSKLPSPWRKNSKRLVYSDELTRGSSPVEKEKEKRPLFAGDIVDDIASKPVIARRMITSNQLNDNLEDADRSEFRIPQKSNFQPRVRASSAAMDLSALLGTASAEKPPASSTTSNPPHQLDRAVRVPQSKTRASIESPESDASRSDCGISLTPIPQKSGFAPRAHRGVSKLMEYSTVKQTKIELSGNILKEHLIPLASGSSNLANLPVTSSLSIPSSAPLYANDSQPTTSTAKETKEPDTRSFKWTETVRLTTERKTPPPPTSPTKSCLRSPIKLPGVPPGLSSPTKGVQFISSSPTPPSPPTTLSPTTWTASHWHLLEEILHTYTQSPPPTSNVYDKGRRHSTRVISKLLGRTVHADEDSMVMEQWHLEVVDAFRGRVPGWEEKVVAMRVFALIVGGRRRREAEMRGTTGNEGRVNESRGIERRGSEQREVGDLPKGKGRARRSAVI